MTRNEARKVWAASGLSYGALTEASVARLRKMIDAEMRASGLIRGTFRAGRARVWRSLRDDVADIRCKAFYFADRQAVTFERDGFVGFAGWADDQNVQPIFQLGKASGAGAPTVTIAQVGIQYAWAYGA
mgnify:CR=1 FL=1